MIPPDEVERLFQPFRQTGKERVRHADGHGLGLAIVQAIAKGHGATISAHAPAAGGLSVEVRFPMPRTIRQGRQSDDAKSAK